MKKLRPIALVIMAALIIAASAFVFTACPSAVSSIAIQESPYNTFFVGDTVNGHLRTKGSLLVTLENGSTRVVNLSQAAVTFEGFDSSAPATNQTITVKYQDKETTFDIDIINPIGSIAVDTANQPVITYNLGAASLNRTQGNIIVTEQSGLTRSVPFDSPLLTFSGFNADTPALAQEITVTYRINGRLPATTTYNVRIAGAANTITIGTGEQAPTLLYHTTSTTIDRTRGFIIVTYQEGYVRAVPFSDPDVSFSYGSFATPSSSVPVTVLYQGMSAVFNIRIEIGAETIDTNRAYVAAIQARTQAEVIAQIANASPTTRLELFVVYQDGDFDIVPFNPATMTIDEFDPMGTLVNNPVTGLPMIANQEIIIRYAGAYVSVTLSLTEDYAATVFDTVVDMSIIHPNHATQIQIDRSIRAIRLFNVQLGGQHPQLQRSSLDRLAQIIFFQVYTAYLATEQVLVADPANEASFIRRNSGGAISNFLITPTVEIATNFVNTFNTFSDLFANLGLLSGFGSNVVITIDDAVIEVSSTASQISDKYQSAVAVPNTTASPIVNFAGIPQTGNVSHINYLRWQSQKIAVALRMSELIENGDSSSQENVVRPTVQGEFINWFEAALDVLYHPTNGFFMPTGTTANEAFMRATNRTLNTIRVWHPTGYDSLLFFVLARVEAGVGGMINARINELFRAGGMPAAFIQFETVRGVAFSSWMNVNGIIEDEGGIRRDTDATTFAANIRWLEAETEILLNSNNYFSAWFASTNVAPIASIGETPYEIRLNVLVNDTTLAREIRPMYLPDRLMFIELFKSDAFSAVYNRESATAAPTAATARTTNVYWPHVLVLPEGGGQAQPIIVNYNSLRGIHGATDPQAEAFLDLYFNTFARFSGRQPEGFDVDGYRLGQGFGDDIALILSELAKLNPTQMDVFFNAVNYTLRTSTNNDFFHSYNRANSTFRTLVNSRFIGFPVSGRFENSNAIFPHDGAAITPMPWELTLLGGIMEAMERYTHASLNTGNFVSFNNSASAAINSFNMQLGDKTLFNQHFGALYARLLQMVESAAKEQSDLVVTSLSTQWQSTFTRLNQYISAANFAFERITETGPILQFMSSVARVRALAEYISQNGTPQAKEIFYHMQVFGTNTYAMQVQLLKLRTQQTLAQSVFAADTYIRIPSIQVGRITTEVWAYFHALYSSAWQIDTPSGFVAAWTTGREFNRDMALDLLVKNSSLSWLEQQIIARVCALGGGQFAHHQIIGGAFNAGLERDLVNAMLNTMHLHFYRQHNIEGAADQILANNNAFANARQATRDAYIAYAEDRRDEGLAIERRFAIAFNHLADLTPAMLPVEVPAA